MQKSTQPTTTLPSSTANNTPSQPSTTNGSKPLSYPAVVDTSKPQKNQNWQIVGDKKKTPLPAKNPLHSRQLVLTRENQTTFNSLEVRNTLNKACANKGVPTPVIASVTCSTKNNIVLTTTLAFNAKYLLENKKVWETILDFNNTLPNQP
ncbi:hypothetical protein EJ04DRAFT_506038 [Polyplosphaeria fusca]|uniref:Uncharacterized protein n=1 Tax=Polyplosphaeria fusca TaxID=682080 RepID=A0A9P4QLX8_9PLEO|nr:hypothetical protein EJ04DRAFT_506038 [Polyplosphaeria fusca]